MENDIIRIVIVAVIVGLLWFANESLNNVPKLKQVISVVIIVVGGLLILLPAIDLVKIALHI